LKAVPHQICLKKFPDRTNELIIEFAMAKTRTAFFCRNCGVESPKWIGRCPSCREWNTYVEETFSRPAKLPPGAKKTRPEPVLISGISTDSEPRINLYGKEFNRILGGGIVPGSVILMGGEPGIGKSTLALQVALHTPSVKTLYISGEESSRQIKLRADRIGSMGGTAISYAKPALKLFIPI
jgi:DNA repair protein RadA/Sms